MSSDDENFVPPSDWDRKKDSDTLILMLPGFKKEQLKVQVSSDRKLRLSGERKISENKWRRFRKEEQLSDPHDASGISAKFEAGMLYVRLPKVIKPTLEEPSKPDQQQTTPPDQKPDSQQPSSDKKDLEQTKTEAQTPPLVQEPKGDHDQDSQKKAEEEKSTVAPEEKTKTSEDKEMQHETTQTALKDQNQDLQKKLSQKEEDHEDVQKKLAQKELDGEDLHQKKLVQKELDDDVQKKLAQKEKGKAEITDGKMGRGSFEELSKRSVVKMKQWFEMICGLVEEVKKQKKVPHFVVLIFLVLLIGLYIKSFVKSSFGGDKDEF